ncbi:MAG: thioredoxin [Thermoguttaceae bacterium]|jgi:thioredoxin 1|nr:thioredoxin [Thermoguttaceae bacterium]
MNSLFQRLPLALTCVGTTLIAALALGCGSDSPGLARAQTQSETELTVEETPDAPEHGLVQYADESNFEQLVLRANRPVLVDFYADWCPPCRIQAPILDDFARETPDVLVVKVDVDQAPQLASQYEIRSIPSLKVFRGGQVVGEHVGVASKEQLKVLTGT